MTRKTRFSFLLGSLIVGFLSILPASSQVVKDWAREYNLSGNAEPVAMTLDKQGNVWVVGTRTNDFATAKFSPAGVRLWEETYGDLLLNSAAAITSDTEDNIWVAGVSSSNRIDGFITLIKYGNDGSRLWVRRFEEPIDDSPYGILGNARERLKLALDSKGNAYALAIGGSNGSFVTTKISPDGDTLWTQHYAPPNGFFAYIGGKGIALDADGNVVIAGYSAAGGGLSAFITVKYNSAGIFQWAAVDDWEGSSSFVTAMDMDSSGNVYLTGASVRGTYHLITVKYSARGETLWVAARPPATGRAVIGRALVVDANGNVIVVGDENWEWNDDYDIYELLTVKYDAAGKEIWAARSAVNNQRSAATIAVDADGSIYVGARDDLTGVPRTMLLKYDAMGTQFWEVFAPALAWIELMVDNAGAIYLKGDPMFTVGSGYSMTRFVQTEFPSQIKVAIEPPRTEAAPGDTVRFSAVVTGAGPFTYRWKRLGFVLQDQTQATLTLNNVQSAGDYTVTVSNHSTSAVSPEARLFINRPVALSAEHTVEGLALWWPASAVEYKLQSALDLTPPVAWLSVPALPSVTANGFRFTTGISGPSHFYRLIRE